MNEAVRTERTALGTRTKQSGRCSRSSAAREARWDLATALGTPTETICRSAEGLETNPKPRGRRRTRFVRGRNELARKSGRRARSRGVRRKTIAFIPGTGRLLGKSDRPRRSRCVARKPVAFRHGKTTICSRRTRADQPVRPPPSPSRWCRYLRVKRPSRPRNSETSPGTLRSPSFFSPQGGSR